MQRWVGGNSAVFNAGHLRRLLVCGVAPPHLVPGRAMENELKDGAEAKKVWRISFEKRGRFSQMGYRTKSTTSTQAEVKGRNENPQTWLLLLL